MVPLTQFDSLTELVSHCLNNDTVGTMYIEEGRGWDIIRADSGHLPFNYKDEENRANFHFLVPVNTSTELIVSNSHRELTNGKRRNGTGSRLLKELENAFTQYGRVQDKKVTIRFYAIRQKVIAWLRKNGYQTEDNRRYHKVLFEPENLK
ncbi:hypothetical protein GOV03_02085 [Candidatus Woesearchaeota archaeon]|nr:hypothetical protein [Candidatus Woesearchaeota archaeon]